MTIDQITDELAAKPAEEKEQAKLIYVCDSQVVGWRGEILKQSRVVDVKLNPNYRPPTIQIPIAERPTDRTRDYSIRDVVLETSLGAVVGGTAGTAFGGWVYYVLQAAPGIKDHTSIAIPIICGAMGAAMGGLKAARDYFDKLK